MPRVSSCAESWFALTRSLVSSSPGSDGISAEYVSFSSDGQFVTYVTFPAGVLWRANRDGSNRVQLTNPPLYPLAPHLSPDGTQILFSEGPQSYLVPSQGGTPRLLAPKEKGGTSDGSWSPDGGKIVFCSFETEEEISFFKLRPADSRPWQPSSHHPPRVSRHLFAAMVAQRPLHRRAPPWCPRRPESLRP